MTATYEVTEHHDAIIGLAVAVGIAFWWAPDLILWLWS